jgi:predicted DsbA family dithiol-disulfide isomerase
MPQIVKIEFVSDVVCPWCAISFHSLLRALDRVQGSITAEISLQPFELDPMMPKGGEDSTAYVARKYGLSPEEAARNRQVIRARAAEVGFDMTAIANRRLYNTFDAHRLLHWAERNGRQVDLKRALFAAHFGYGADVSDHDVLARAAETVGLDLVAARQILTSDAFAREVRTAEETWRGRGVQSVPTLVFAGKYVSSGARTPDEFEQLLGQAASLVGG